MEIISTSKGRTIKTAIVHPLGGPVDKDAALEIVMAHFGERKSSLFGWRVLEGDDGMVTVDLYLD